MILTEKNTLWKTTPVNVEGSPNISKIHFYDENLGYAISNEKFDMHFYATRNGGKSWERKGTIANFVGIDFLVTELGHAIVVGNKYGPSPLIAENGSYILETNNDGLSWQTNFVSGFSLLEKICAGANGSFAAVGWKNTGQINVKRKNLVLISKDNGQSWLDVSDGLNQKVDEEKIKIDQGLTDVTFWGNEGIFVLTLRGKIYNTVNGGESWSLFSEIVDEDEAQTNFHVFGQITDKEFWIAGKASSKEGTWTSIGRINSNNNLEKLRLDGFALSGITFLTSQEIMACGSFKKRSKSSTYDGSSLGTIIYSSDGGDHWGIVYESEVSTNFPSISKISQFRLIVSGEKGEIIHLERNQP